MKRKKISKHAYFILVISIILIDFLTYCITITVLYGQGLPDHVECINSIACPYHRLIGEALCHRDGIHKVYYNACITLFHNLTSY